MNHDLTKLAHEMRERHAQGKPWRLPAMTMRELGAFTRLLDGRTAQASSPVQLH